MPTKSQTHPRLKAGILVQSFIVKPLLFSIISILFSSLVIVLAFIVTPFKPFLPHLNFLLGITKPTSYIVLLGNDTEMRANGGFTGSYSKIIAKNEQADSDPSIRSLVANQHFDITFQDIYVPNGQLDGYVAPPFPVQQAFGKGSWELANADWEPDFTESAKSIRWFFEKGKEINPDNLILLNLSTIRKVLQVVGEIEVSEYNATITPENVYLFLQGKAEVGFFPGSTQKKDALSSVGKALLSKLTQLPFSKKVQIASMLYQDLKNQNILIHSTNSDLQSLLEENNFAGTLSSDSMDTFSLIETNLGANKANQFISRSTEHHITYSSGLIHHQAKVSFENSSPDSNPNPPLHYGGNYIAYMRIYIPTRAINIYTSGENLNNYRNLLPTVTGPIANSKYGLTELGFWHTTLAGSKSSVIISYDLPVSDISEYSFGLLKQHGMYFSPQKINLLGKTIYTSLEKDFLYP